ncbi:MAG: LytTR family transcriptional regulator DNA-binding domain-containing protein [Bacteroidales bacterium]
MTEVIRTIIVEDEPPARMKLVSFITRCPELDMVHIFSDATSALAYIKENPDCLVFLDVHMEGLSGIQMLEQLIKLPKVIITSAYEEYALKGFEYNVSDYLLKPYSFDRFRRGVDKVLREIKMEKRDEKEEESYILVKTEHRLEKIALSSILYVEGMKDYLRIHTTSKKIMTLRNFSSLTTELPADQFIRIHKSYLIALTYLSAIGKDWVMIGDCRIPIGRSYKEDFLRQVRDSGVSSV